MADQNAIELLRTDEKMFSKKFQLDTLWQRLAEEFYPERADFTRTRLDGDEFAEQLFESTPAQNRRELAYAMGSLMRPPAKKWFKQTPKDEDLKKVERVQGWCAYSSDQMRGLIYAGRSGWQRAIPEGDNDVIAFGNAVHSMAEGPDRDGSIYYDTHHLRDCAWTEDKYRVVNRLDRKIKLALRNWEQTFPGVKLDEKWVKLRQKTADHEIDVRHIVLPVAEYDSYSSKKRDRRQRYASAYIDVEHRKIIREGFYFEFPYFVRRWLLRHGSPYGYSPAAMLGLIDARVLQAQSRVILDAGELAVRPPVLVRDEVLGDASLYAGAMNWVSGEYDERFGDAIKTLDMGGNLQIGLEMKVDTRQILAAAFYLNKLTLPSDKDMTAYEVSERLSEYIRSIGPVVEPFEADNTQSLDITFAMGLRLGRFGPMESIPPELRGQDLGYEFDTPIQIAYARQKKARAQEVVEYAGGMAQALGDSAVLDNLDKDRLFRDGVRAVDGEHEWLRPSEDVAGKRQADAEAMQAQIADQQMAQGIDTVGKVADTVPKIANAGATIAGMLGGPAAGGQPAMDEMWPEDPEASTGAMPQQSDSGGQPRQSVLASMFSGAEDVDPETIDATAMGDGEPMPEAGQQPQRMPAVREPEPIRLQPSAQQGGDGDDELKAMVKQLIATIGAEQQIVRDTKGRVTGIKRVVKGNGA